MPAQLTRGKTFAATEQVTNTKLHQLIDSGTIANIDQSNIVASSGLVVQSASQPSNTDALWNDTGNNLLKYLRSGSYVALIDIPSDQTMTGAKTFDDITLGAALKTAAVGLKGTATSAISSAVGIRSDGGLLPAADPATPLANTLYVGSVLKAWIKFNGTGSVAINDSYNVTSITDNATGTYTITWDTDFANTNYSATMASNQYPLLNTFATGTLQVNTSSDSSTLVDASIICIHAIGDQ